jgi:hypothetical protein
MVIVSLSNPGFPAVRRALIDRLQRIDPSRVVWVRAAATEPGFFLESGGVR